MAGPDRTPGAAPAAQSGGQSGARRGVRRRAGRARWIRRAALLLVAFLATGAVVYVGLDRPAADPPPTGTTQPTPSVSPSAPLPSVDLSHLPIDRQPFCDKLASDDVERALGSPVASTYHYDNGDRRKITPSLTDVAHEYNCTYVAADGTQARAWVFAQPVPPGSAAGLARDAVREPHCGRLTGAPTFGTPAVATVCHQQRPNAVAVTLSGLFGQAWLSCQLTTHGRGGAGATATRADQWCVEVATTLGARP